MTVNEESTALNLRLYSVTHFLGVSSAHLPASPVWCLLVASDRRGSLFFGLEPWMMKDECFRLCGVDSVGLY